MSQINQSHVWTLFGSWFIQILNLKIIRQLEILTLTEYVMILKSYKIFMYGDIIVVALIKLIACHTVIFTDEMKKCQRFISTLK